MSGQDEANSGEGKGSKDMFDRPKQKPKMIRVLTVLAYVLSVSMAAILLSIYYIFMWDGRPHLGAQVSDLEMINGGVGTYLNDRNTSSSRFFQNKTNRSTSIESLVKTEIFQDANVTEDSILNNLTLPNDTFADDVSNKTQSRTKRESNDVDVMMKYLSMLEMQQQITALESEPLKATTPGPSSVYPTTTTEETFTWSDDYESFEELGKASILVRKIMDGENYEEN